MIVFLSTRRNIWECSGKFTGFSVYVCRKELILLQRDSSLCYASFRMTRFCFLLTIRNLNYFWNAKIFSIILMFLREQSWRNSFALKRWGNWCDDVVMWWCGDVTMWWCDDVVMWWCDDVVMWWWDGSHGLKIWGIGFYAKTTAPIDNATLTDTIFFSPTLKGGKLFIVSCEFWVFLYTKFFLFSLCI